MSVCVPGAYVAGIDTDGDGSADVTSADASEGVKGSLVIDYDAQIVSTNGQVYTAAAAPVVINTGAAGYGSQSNSLASTSYAADGYINVSCGNRGKQDTATDADGNAYYTGDAPSCLVDQKAAALMPPCSPQLATMLITTTIRSKQALLASTRTRTAPTPPL